jgi:hypothetical protein
VENNGDVDNCTDNRHRIVAHLDDRTVAQRINEKGDSMRTPRPWVMRAYWSACALSIALLVLTLIDPQWIERWFDESPDDGDGTVERWIVAGCFLVLAMVAGWLAQRERRRGLVVLRS